jgi:hypothetical protein
VCQQLLSVSGSLQFSGGYVVDGDDDDDDGSSSCCSSHSVNSLHLAVLSGQISTVSRFLRCIKSFDDHDFFTTPPPHTTTTSNYVRSDSFDQTIGMNEQPKIPTPFPLGKRLLLGEGEITTSTSVCGESRLTPSALAIKCRFPMIYRELVRFERFYKIN